jgi:hypothetical protein
VELALHANSAGGALSPRIKAKLLLALASERHCRGTQPFNNNPQFDAEVFEIGGTIGLWTADLQVRQLDERRIDRRRKIARLSITRAVVPRSAHHRILPLIDRRLPTVRVVT